MTALLLPYRVDFVAVIRTKARRKGGQQPFFPLHPTLVLRIRHKRVRKFFPPVSPGGWPTLTPPAHCWVAYPFRSFHRKGGLLFAGLSTLSPSIPIPLRLAESGSVPRTRSLQRKPDPHPISGGDVCFRCSIELRRKSAALRSSESSVLSLKFADKICRHKSL